MSIHARMLQDQGGDQWTVLSPLRQQSEADEIDNVQIPSRRPSATGVP